MLSMCFHVIGYLKITSKMPNERHRTLISIPLMVCDFMMTVIPFIIFDQASLLVANSAHVEHRGMDGR